MRLVLRPSDANGERSLDETSLRRTAGVRKHVTVRSPDGVDRCQPLAMRIRRSRAAAACEGRNERLIDPSRASALPPPRIGSASATTRLARR